MAGVGKLSAILTLNSAKFTTGLDKARKSNKSFLDGIKKGIATVARYGATMAAVAAGGLALMTRQSLKSIDALAKTSEKLGLTTEALAGLHHAAEISGVKVATFDMALQRMVRRVAEAAVGTGEAKAAIKELGLDAKRLAALSPDETFKELSDAMNKVTSSGHKVRLAMKLFDSEGVALVNTMNLGSAGIEELQADAEALGLTFTELAAKRVEKANDSIKVFTSSIKGMANTLAIRLAPTIEKVAQTLTGLAMKLKDIDGALVKQIAKTGAWVASIGAAIYIIPKIIKAIRALIVGIKAITSSQIVMQSFAGPAGWLAIAAGAAIAATAIVGVGAAFDSISSTVDTAITEAQELGASLGIVATQYDKATEAAKKWNPDPFDRITKFTAKMDDITRLQPMVKRWQKSLITPLDKLKNEFKDLEKALQLDMLTQREYDELAESIEKRMKGLVDATKQVEKANKSGSAKQINRAFTALPSSVSGVSATAALPSQATPTAPTKMPGVARATKSVAKGMQIIADQRELDLLSKIATHTGDNTARAA